MTGVTMTAEPATELVAAPGPAREQVADRLAPPMPQDRLLGWLVALVVTTIAGVLRLRNLGHPDAFVFDETYYAKDGWSLLHFGAEQEWVKDADKAILAGDIDKWTGSPAYVVHPPVGKWIIALGEQAVGFNPAGWRLPLAVLGTLSVLIMVRVARRMFRSTLLGGTAGLLLAMDGMHFVESRTALLDLILMFWAFAAFGCLVLDRDATRRRLAAALRRGDDLGPLGPRLGLRPWRLAAGVCLGLACGTKWSGVWFVAAFGLLSWFWDWSARRAAGLRPRLAASADAAVLVAAAVVVVLVVNLFRASSVTTLVVSVAAVAVGALVLAVVAFFLRVPARTVRFGAGHGLAAVGSLVVLPVMTYLASWTGWFRADPSRAYNRKASIATVDPEGWTAVLPGALRALGDYHRQAYEFHRGLTSHHDYASNPWGWPILSRPVSMHYRAPEKGKDGCGVDKCSEAILALGTPALWWAGALAVVAVAVYAVGRGDWRATAILTGFAASYLPWFAFQERTIYSFYAVVMVPWIVLALTMCLGWVIGPPDATDRRRIVGTSAAGTYICLVVLNFAFLHPILSAQVIPTSDWSLRMWLGSWI